MEQNTYYVRLRGRISGPYPLAELQRLVARGAISRIHEISRDKIAWSVAERFESLYPSQSPGQMAGIGLLPPPPPPVAPRVQKTAATPGPVEPPPPPLEPLVVEGERPLPPSLVDPSETQRFYYRQRGITVGPMPWNRLKDLASAGKVDPAAQVWSGVGEQPVAASSVPWLAFAARPAPPPATPALSPGVMWILIGIAGIALLIVMAVLTYALRKMVGG